MSPARCGAGFEFSLEEYLTKQCYSKITDGSIFSLKRNALNLKQVVELNIFCYFAGERTCHVHDPVDLAPNTDTSNDNTTADIVQTAMENTEICDGFCYTEENLSIQPDGSKPIQ